MDLKWYEISPKNKRTFMLLIHMAQKPIVLKAAGVVNITLATLMSVSNRFESGKQEEAEGDDFAVQID